MYRIFVISQKHGHRPQASMSCKAISSSAKEKSLLAVEARSHRTFYVSASSNLRSVVSFGSSTVYWERFSPRVVAKKPELPMIWQACTVILCCLEPTSRVMLFSVSKLYVGVSVRSSVAFLGMFEDGSEVSDALLGVVKDGPGPDEPLVAAVGSLMLGFANHEVEGVAVDENLKGAVLLASEVWVFRMTSSIGRTGDFLGVDDAWTSREPEDLGESDIV